MGEASRDDRGRAVVKVGCTCLKYANRATGKTVHKAWREARRVHAQHVEAMGEK